MTVTFAWSEKKTIGKLKQLTPGYLSGVSGTYAPPECYMVEEEAAEQFDNAFPKKEKQHLPGQLF